MRRDLQNVARDIWSLALKDDRPTGPEMQQRYGLNESQYNGVKRHVRELAAEAGILWGLYPPTGRYLAISPSLTGIAGAILDYQLRHWQEEGYSTKLTVRAAARQGLITFESSNQVDSLADEFDKRIDRLRRDIQDGS